MTQGKRKSQKDIRKDFCLCRSLTFTLNISVSVSLCFHLYLSLCISLSLSLPLSVSLSLFLCPALCRKAKTLYPKFSCVIKFHLRISSVLFFLSRSWKAGVFWRGMWLLKSSYDLMRIPLAAGRKGLEHVALRALG